MDKVQTKHVCGSVGVPMAAGKVVGREKAYDAMPAPFVIKPIAEGSSVGVRIVKNGDNFAPDADWHYGDDVLVEEYIPGRELTVGVMGDRALDVTEIKPKESFFDYTAKYTEGRAVHLVPAPVPAPVYDEAMRVALLAHQTIGCRGVTRSDFRYDDTHADPGRLVFLEINTQPGMTPLSLVPEQAQHHGISFTQLVTWMVEEARCDS
jgi:D-alanine-D-alanine ligase